MRLIHQLSKETGIPIHTIRYYENFGLIAGEKNETIKTNNYTFYRDEVVEKLHLIKAAKQIGFTLGEIKQLLHAWHGKTLSSNEKIEVFESKTKEVDAKIQQLKNVKKMLAEIVKKIENGTC